MWICALFTELDEIDEEIEVVADELNIFSKQTQKEEIQFKDRANNHPKRLVNLLQKLFNYKKTNYYKRMKILKRQWVG